MVLQWYKKHIWSPKRKVGNQFWTSSVLFLFTYPWRVHYHKAKFKIFLWTHGTYKADLHAFHQKMEIEELRYSEKYSTYYLYLFFPLIKLFTELRRQCLLQTTCKIGIGWEKEKKVSDETMPENSVSAFI